MFAAEPRSYRDLPLRLAEYGQVYRWERSGALSGLARVRGMCMNDGHIYCTAEQMQGEIRSLLSATAGDEAAIEQLREVATRKLPEIRDLIERTQIVRDWLETTGWDKNSPPPELPGDVVKRTREKYVEAFERLTGRKSSEI